MIKPGKYDPIKPDIELFDYKSKKRYGLKLDGTNALQVGTISQDDSVQVRSAGKRVGDFDEQRSWKAGRGIEKLSDNADGYWDAKDAWTLSEGHVHQSLLWRPAKGLRSSDFFLPDNSHSLTWIPVVGASFSNSFTRNSVSSYTAGELRLWVRKVGNPGTLRAQICSDSSGNPGTVLSTIDITGSAVSDTLSKFVNFTNTTTISTSTTYHILVHDQSGTDDRNNHWEVGVYYGGSSGRSLVGGSWQAAGFDLYFYVAALAGSRRFYSFFLDSALYVIKVQDFKTTNATTLYINGDRGKATSATVSSLTDSAKSWLTNQWSGAWCKIIRGTGAGQTARISSNNSTVLTFDSILTGGFITTPDSTSEYIIYAADWWTEITTTGLSSVKSNPVVVNQIVYFPQGSGTNIRWMVWDSTTKAHLFGDDGTNKADFMIANVTKDAGTTVWRALNTVTIGGTKQISNAPATVYATSPTTLVYGTAKDVGDSTYLITGMCERDGQIWIFKEDSLWLTDSSFFLTKIQNGGEKMPSPFNGFSSIAHDKFIIYSWLHSLVRGYGSNHDNIGQDWSGQGLPDTREGHFASLDSYASLLIGAVDAGDGGTSSVLGFDGLGWHELIRGYDSGKRCRFVKVQPNEGTRNRMWVDFGGDLVFQEMPFQKSSPRLDSGCRYMHEAVVESAAIDMGTASSLAKFVKELTVYCDNLGDSNSIEVEYQVDDDVQTSNWTSATILYQSPEAIAFLGLSNVRRFAYRLIISSSDNTKPVDIKGVIPNGYARSPYKMVWTLRCRADNVTSRGRLVKPDILMRWLLDNARFPGRLEMQSQYELAHKFFVIVHPPRMFPYKPAQNGQAEESIFTLVLEEA
jgi:hypothetical protein